MKNILFNSFANIDDDLLDMTAKKIKHAKPRKIVLRVTGLVAAAAACVFAVNFGLSFVNKNKIPVQSEGSSYEKVFMPYQGKEFVIDYDNLPFKCNIGELTKLNPDPIVNYTGIGSLRFLSYDISEYIGNNLWNENLEITEMPVFQTIDQDSRIISFNESLENYNENGEIESEELKRLAEKYSEKLGFDDYETCLNSLYRLSDEGLVKVWINSIYPSSENIFEAILNSNFRQVFFTYTQELLPYSLKISYNDSINSLECIGFYPIISAKEAREKLISEPHNYCGNPISEDFFKDGKNVDKIKHVELGYAGAVDGKSLPYYVFYIEDTEDYDDLPEGINHYTTALYPAVSPEYLMDRTEQNLAEENNNSSSTEQKAFYDDTFVGVALQGSGALPTSENIKETVVTSTTQNPAGYTQKVALDAVVDFLRSDWKARGVSTHFDGSAS